MGHIIDEVSLHFIDLFLLPDRFIYKHECRIADEEDQSKRQQRPQEIIFYKVGIILKLREDGDIGIVGDTHWTGGVGIFFYSLLIPHFLDQLPVKPPAGHSDGIKPVLSIDLF
jgi:hypothetical protein